MNQPFVSIIIPVYNGADYLREAIDSALAQTYPNIEVLVINDGSTDDGATEKIALSYGDQIRYFAKENGGVSSALNLGIREMRGTYFSWLSHDDLYAPEKIEKQVSLISSEKDMILCSGSLMDAQGNPMRHHVKRLDARLNGRALFAQFLKGYILNGLGFLIPRTAFEKAGTFDESMRYLQDLDLWLRMMWYDFSFVCHKDLLVVSRIHRGQTTNTMHDQFDVDRTKLAQKHALLLQETEVVERESLLKLYLLLFVRGNNPSGIALFQQALKESGCSKAVFIQCVFYRLGGSIKRMLRQVRDFLLKIKKARD